MKALLFLLIITVAFSSCLNKKYLSKNQVVFKVEDAGQGKSKITAYNTGSNRIQINALQLNNTLLVERDSAEKGGFILPTVVESSFDTGAKYSQLQVSQKYYYPETHYPQKADSNSNNLFVVPPTLRFSENHRIFQVVTVPLKVRPSFSNKRIKDSLPTQALAELNIGVAYGFKRTWTRFLAHPGIDGVSFVNTSFSCTGFLTFGGTNVKPITTRYLLPYEKTEYAVSYGLNFLVGYYNLNLGVSIGADRLIERSSGSRWIYDGNLWYGITVAYDIFR